MKIVYIGSKGMLGHDFMDAAKARPGAEAVGLDIPEIDITNPQSVEAALPDCDVVVNGAAYTRVDDAEREISSARLINADGARNVAAVCGGRGIRLLHVSTDYVFNGRKGTPYVEEDEPDPISMYGLTKREGEVLVKECCDNAMIVRTQSLYGIHGRNFVKAILGQVIKGKRELTVVSDQVSSPTYTRHLADALLNLAEIEKTGTVHAASRGSCSWFQFADEILRLLDLKNVSVTPMSASELNYPAPRPAFSVLATDRYTEWTGSLMPDWEDGLKAYLQEEDLVKEAGRIQGS